MDFFCNAHVESVGIYCFSVIGDGAVSVDVLIRKGMQYRLWDGCGCVVAYSGFCCVCYEHHACPYGIMRVVILTQAYSGRLGKCWLMDTVSGLTMRQLMTAWCSAIDIRLSKA